ncbi:MAG: polysaccharide biosynthesis/export family protein, partial [Pseudomonadota bacterium]
MIFLARHILLWPLAALIVFSANANAQSEEQDALIGAASYQLNTGDNVRITVFEEPDLSITAVLDDSGAISYPLLGELNIRGLTARELE